MRPAMVVMFALLAVAAAAPKPEDHPLVKPTASETEADRPLVKTSETARLAQDAELAQHRMLLYLSLGAVLSLAAVLAALLLLLLLRHRSQNQQPVEDQTRPAVERLAVVLAERQLASGGDGRRPRTTSVGSTVVSVRPSVNYHQYEPIRKELLLPLSVAPPPPVPHQYEGSCAASQVYESLLDR